MPADQRVLGQAMAAVVRARVAWREHRFAEALSWLERSEFRPTPEVPRPPVGIHGLGLQLRPAVLRALGREREALAWYQTGPWFSAAPENTLIGLVHAGPAHLVQAKILEQSGRPDLARQHYARFAEQWRGAEPALQLVVAAARGAAEGSPPDADRVITARR